MSQVPRSVAGGYKEFVGKNITPIKLEVADHHLLRKFDGKKKSWQVKA
jgi:hypothetical protein